MYSCTVATFAANQLISKNIPAAQSGKRPPRVNTKAVERRSYYSIFDAGAQSLPELIRRAISYNLPWYVMFIRGVIPVLYAAPQRLARL